MLDRDDLPPLPEGFSARGASMADSQAVTGLVIACNLAAFGKEEMDRDEIEADWRRPSMDIERDEHLVFDEDGCLVAWAELYLPWDAQTAILPEARGRGIGLHLVRWTERRAVERARSRGSAQTRVRQSVSDADEAAHRLFRSAGHSPAWESWIFEIEIEIGEEILLSPIPEGVTIRPFDPERDARAVHQVIDDAFNEWEGREPEPYEDWREYTLARDAMDPSLWLVAVSEGSIVGAVNTFHYPEDGDAWIEEVAVARAHRRRGIAKALLATTFGELGRRGARTAQLSTDSRGGARALYESVGMHITRSYTKFERALSV